MNLLSRLVRTICAIGVMTLHLTAPASAASAPPAPQKPTVLLVHGAFAESASWDAVVRRLRDQNFPVVAVANPLRGVKSDAASVAALIDAVQGPVVLVGHSYGGSVISAAAEGKPNVKALVFVAGFAPVAGESALDLSSKFPGSTLGAALAPPVALPDGTKDLYIRQDLFAQQFAADLPPEAARVMAVSQRPVAESALVEPAASSAWRTVPSWFVYGDRDKNIPAAVMAFMAQRAQSRGTVVVEGASHALMASRPDAVAQVIVEAADAVLR